MNSGIPIPYLEMMPNATGASCPWSPLTLEDDEGDNFTNDTIVIPTLMMKNETSNDSCPWIPIDIDDAEGDDFAPNSNISIPLLPMKTGTISIPELSMKPTSIVLVAPTLAHQTVTKKLKAPNLSQTAHPTPHPTTGPKPIAAGGRCDIVFTHSRSLKDDKARFEWKLYDPTGHLAGGGNAGKQIQCFERPEKNCFPFSIYFELNEKDVNNKVDFWVMLDIPSNRRLWFNDRHDNVEIPEDGYPGESYGCKDDSRNERTRDVSRTTWCYFEWLGAGGWDGYSDHGR